MKLSRTGLLWLEEYDGIHTYLWEPLRKGQWRVGFTSEDRGKSWENVKDIFQDSEGINPIVIYPSATFVERTEEEVIFMVL